MQQTFLNGNIRFSSDRLCYQMNLVIRRYEERNRKIELINYTFLFHIFHVSSTNELLI